MIYDFLEMEIEFTFLLFMENILITHLKTEKMLMLKGQW